MTPIFEPLKKELLMRHVIFASELGSRLRAIGTASILQFLKAITDVGNWAWARFCFYGSGFDTLIPSRSLNTTLMTPMLSLHRASMHASNIR